MGRHSRESGRELGGADSHNLRRLNPGTQYQVRALASATDDEDYFKLTTIAPTATTTNAATAPPAATSTYYYHARPLLQTLTTADCELVLVLGTMEVHEIIDRLKSCMERVIKSPSSPPQLQSSSSSLCSSPSSSPCSSFN